MDADQVKLLRKGPSFCPTPKDINSQSVYDDLEVFEARLRTVAFFIYSNPDDNLTVPSHLPRVTKDRKWKPPTSRYSGVVKNYQGEIKVIRDFLPLGVVQK
ncbi:hypothetical protein AWC38_SpisGene722 [Stylophora pistillata]|uniref:Uncharacterized protein n=1 Tax=Stylophora pistillata TaxID=50429 RepID=A0A2B4SYZ0_STYPI|nr:hypothetical protein AWC38_SpisGene722 [Stylophora pistillata]